MKAIEFLHAYGYIHMSFKRRSRTNTESFCIVQPDGVGGM
jgi:hypothetical protein